MKPVKKWRERLLILLLLAGLAVLPPLAYGYACLERAARAATDAEASADFETAARLLFWRADLFEKAGLRAGAEPSRAMRLLESARANQALSPAGLVALGDAYLATGDTTRAVTEWETILQYKTIPAQVYPRLAQQYHAAQKYSAERRVLNLWLDSDPTNPQASEWMGRLLAAEASPAALSLLQNAATQSPQAAARLEQLITALQTPAPTDEPAYLLALCGQALAGMGEWRLAEQAFERAAQANPQYASAWAWLGSARQHNHSVGSLSALENAIRLDGNSAAIHAMLGNYWQNEGELKKAVPEFQSAVQIEPSNPAWWLALAGAQTDLAAALNAYIKAVNIAPDQAGYWYALAAFCVEKDAFIEDYGLNAALRAFALEPKNPDYIDMLGRAQLAIGQWQAAEVSFNTAINLAAPSQLALYHFHLGLLYFQTERKAQAKDEFEQTLRLDPSGTPGVQANLLIQRYFPQN